MKNSVFFKNLDYSQAVEQFTLEKLEKQNSLENANIRWVFSKEKEIFHARATIQIGGKRYSVESTSGDIYCAIDLSIHQLKRSASKIRDKYKDYRKYQKAS